VDTHNISFYFGSNFKTWKSPLSPFIIGIYYSIHLINFSFILGDNYIFVKNIEAAALLYPISYLDHVSAPLVLRLVKMQINQVFFAAFY